MNIYRELDRINDEDSLQEDVLLEVHVPGDKRLRQACITAINACCGTTFSPNDFMIHHHDNNHDNCDIDNLRLLFRYSVKDKSRGEYQNANSSIHMGKKSEHSTNNKAGSGIAAIMVGDSLKLHRLVRTYYY